MKTYLRNVKSVLRLHKQDRWFNNRSVYNYIFWYTIKYFKYMCNNLHI